MLNDGVIKAAFVISFIGHCLVLSMPGFNLSSLQSKKPEEITVEIEIEKPLLLPKIDVMGEEKKLKEVIEEQIKEEVELIDPTQEAMLRYQDMVKQRIEQVRKYPSFAKRQGIEGTVHLNFQVSSNGLSEDIKIVSSSGSKILDEEAVATIQRANPFPPIPPEINQAFVAMQVAIVYALN